VTVVVVVVTWWLPRCVIGHQCLQDLRRVNRAVNIRDTAETKEDQVLRRVRFVDLRRTAGLYCGAFLVNTRPHLVRSSHQKLHSHTTQSVTVMSRPHLEEVWGAPTRAHYSVRPGEEGS